MDQTTIKYWFQNLQQDICDSLEILDGNGQFITDEWSRPGGGGGRSRVITNGNLIEKGGVNFSAVHGKTPEKVKLGLKLNDAEEFFASGVSIVLHPENPWVPIIHMNVRYFEMSDGTHWFGGGIDLTPHYVFPEDASVFHQYLKATCDKHLPDSYQKFKERADDYFFIKHRDETRGIGGIFYDRLQGDTEAAKLVNWNFTQAVGKTFIPAYSEMVKSRRNMNYGDQEKNWQYIRRGRYVEFNLVYDKGTKFGLDTDGRAESILMSLPPTANWEYMHEVGKNSKEHQTLEYLKKGIDWVNGTY